MSDQRLGLFNAPSDILALVAQLLPAKEVATLWECGSRWLNYNFGELGAVTRLSFSVPQGRIGWPCLVFRYTKLERLSLSFFGEGTLLIVAPVIDPQWSKTIREIELRGAGCFNFWTTVDSAQCFPSLEKLVLIGIREDLTVAHLQSFPRSLASLDFMALNSCSYGAEYLPRMLVELKLYAQLRYDLKELPPTLETLSTGPWLLRPNQLADLPFGLTSLDFCTEKSEIPTIVALVPRQLTKLNITYSGGSYLLPTFPASDLPPCLEQLDIIGDIIVDLRQLPRTLTHFSVHGTMQLSAASDLAFLPPTLRTFSTSGFVALVKDGDTVAMLPRLLTTLCFLGSDYLRSSGFLTDATAKHLPPSLTHLTYAETDTALSGACFAALPRNLRHLQLSIATGVQDSHIGDLPPYLSVLLLSKCTGLGNDCVPLLPRMLTRFNASAQRFNSDCFVHLPPSLKSFETGQDALNQQFKLFLKLEKAGGPARK